MGTKTTKIANIAKNAKIAVVLMGIGWFAKLDLECFVGLVSNVTVMPEA